jgi:tetratricopeptide (TPR) repeat protein
MKLKTISLILLFPLLSFGQNSIIGRARYIPKQNNPGTAPLLHLGYLWNSLEPLPAYKGLPPSLPPEIALSATEYQVWKRLQNAGIALSQQDPETARELYQDVLKDYPENIQVMTGLADSLFALKDYEGAKETYTAIIDQNPFHFQALNNLAWMMCTVHEEGIYDPVTALAYAKRAQLILQGSHHVWSTLSQAYYELGDYAKAANAAQTALQLANQDSIPIQILMNYLIQFDRCKMALEATSILE